MNRFFAACLALVLSSPALAQTEADIREAARVCVTKLARGGFPAGWESCEKVMATFRQTEEAKKAAAAAALEEAQRKRVEEIAKTLPAK